MNKKILVSLVCVTWSCLMVEAQSLPPAGPSQIGKFFPTAAIDAGQTISPAGQSNLNALIGGYISPLAEDIGSLGNSGWYNTGATHKKWGFDISISANAISANNDSKYFGINTLNAINYSGTTSGGAKSPTAYGPETEFPILSYASTAGANGIVPITFLGPGGGNISKDVPVGSVAIPTVQAGLGLFANTDLRVRYTPETSINGTKLGNWGLGIMHDIKQHIPGIKMAPIGLSLLVAYSQQTSTTDLGGLYGNSASTPTTYTGQEAKGESKSYTAQVLISKSIPVLTFYGGLGYNNATTTYSINGSYYVDHAYLASGVSAPLVQSKTLVNPFSQQYSVSGVRFTGGVRMKFGPIFLNGDYTYFNSKGLYTLGFGVTVR